MQKEDEDGNGLEGAVFKIIDSEGKTVKDDLISKEGGKSRLAIWRREAINLLKTCA
ncbi:hypothetical protein PO124_34185 [Bacillus licheniformis]|nr:hypothetical protein [Bacillus licheniformis]